MNRRAIKPFMTALSILGLSAFPAHAGTWGDLWGTMLWGAATVPLLGDWALVTLGIGLGLVASRALQRGHARSLVLVLAAMLIMTPIAIRALTLPNTFTNGTVADANEVNANFETLRSSLESGPEVTKWGWQAAHFAAAAACRGSTTTGGGGPFINRVRVRDSSVGLNCNQICSLTNETCDAEISIGGLPRQGTVNGEAVGFFYNYSCAGVASAGSDPQVTEDAIGDPATGGSIAYSYCCCRQ